MLSSFLKRQNLHLLAHLQHRGYLFVITLSSSSSRCCSTSKRIDGRTGSFVELENISFLLDSFSLEEMSVNISVFGSWPVSQFPNRLGQSLVNSSLVSGLATSSSLPKRLQTPCRTCSPLILSVDRRPEMAAKVYMARSSSSRILFGIRNLELQGLLQDDDASLVVVFENAILVRMSQQCQQQFNRKPNCSNCDFVGLFYSSRSVYTGTGRDLKLSEIRWKFVQLQ